jgi:hypothetical protein
VIPIDKAAHSVEVGEKGVAVQARDEVEAKAVPGASSAAFEQSKGSANLWIGLGIAFAVIALVFLPPLFGGLGILFGYLAMRKGSKSGGVATMCASGAAMALGMILGVLVAVS